MRRHRISIRFNSGEYGGKYLRIEWKKHGLIIKYLSPYSPELNLIEILWRRIKYTWLPFSAYACLNALSEALETILSQVGSEYQITFA